MDKKHSPLPWGLNKTETVIGADGKVAGCTNFSYTIGRYADTQIANGDFILKAVNNHYQLVDTLVNVKDRIEELIDDDENPIDNKTGDVLSELSVLIYSTIKNLEYE